MCLYRFFPMDAERWLCNAAAFPGEASPKLGITNTASPKQQPLCILNLVILNEVKDLLSLRGSMQLRAKNRSFALLRMTKDEPLKMTTVNAPKHGSCIEARRSLRCRNCPP